MARIGIAGAGLLGRLLAWRLSAEHEVWVADPADGPGPRQDGRGPAGFSAAGMLSPLAELEHAPPEVAALGWRSLPRWRAIVDALAPDPASAAEWLQQRGSLLLAHPGDRGAAARVLDRLAHAAPPDGAQPRALSADALQALEPALRPGLLGWQLPGEGRVLPHAVLPALCARARGVRWHWGRRVQAVRPGALELDDGQTWAVDWALDTRGLGARPDWPLRGVRGELLWLHAPGLGLRHPLRLMHPRHRVYLVPRPGDQVVVGASEVEGEDRSPVSLRSAVELLSAAQSVLPELAEARIVHLETQLRPALPDHRPRTRVEPGLLRLNGLYRHGWLMAPALVDDALAQAGLAPTRQEAADVLA